MNNARRLAYQKCFRPVLYYYVPSEAAGLRPSTEKALAMMIAWECDANGVAQDWDEQYLAAHSRLSMRTLRRYLSVMIDTGWLIKTIGGDATHVRIDPHWLQSLPPVPLDASS